MAMRKNLVADNGIAVANAYCKVEGIQLTKDRIRFSVNCYVDNSGEHKCFTSFGFNSPYVIDVTNPIKQAYEFAKKQAKFADAEDC
jgi:hypothetical protein